MRLQIARPMPVPGYFCRVCSRWKITKICSQYCCSMPMPLSRTANSQCVAVAAGRDVDLRRAIAAELDAVADQVLEQLDQLRLVALDGRQRDRTSPRRRSRR